MDMMTIIGLLGRVASRRDASRPSISGIVRSMRTTSGRIRFDELDRLSPRVRHPDDIDTGQGFQDASQGPEEDMAIVDDDKAQGNPGLRLRIDRFGFDRGARGAAVSPSVRLIDRTMG